MLADTNYVRAIDNMLENAFLGNNLDSSLETIENLDSFITRKKPLLEMWKQKQKMQKKKLN